MIPLSRPSITQEDLNAVTETLKSGWLTHGPKNREFEEAFSRYIGVKYSVTLNSCTSALDLTIRALGIKGEVILPSFTFVASANAVVTAGCKPVFADIEFNTCNISPKQIEQLITKNTEAVMVVHYAGCSCDMKKIMEITKKNKLALIEDSAETIGGEFEGRKVGSFGVGCFSFFPTKNLTTCEGGMVTTDDKALAEKIKVLSAHGIKKDTILRVKEKKPWHREASLPGYNYRMSNVSAALGLSQLKRIDEFNNKRRYLAKLYNKNLSKLGVQFTVEPDNCKHIYQMYTIKVAKAIRNKMCEYLKNKGIEVSVHFDPPVHKQDYYARTMTQKLNLPVTEKVSRSILSLPMYPDLKEDDVVLVCNSIKESLDELGVKCNR